MQPSPSSIKEKLLRRTLLDNPIIAKELKSRMRGRQGATMITVYLGLIAFFISISYLYMGYDGVVSRNEPDYLQIVGKAVFSAVVIIELLMIAFIGPALTSGAISSERERQTFDLLRISLLSPRDLVIGKLGSALIYLLLLIFTAIPLQSLAFFLGGIGLPELIISTVMLVASAFLFCTLGLYFSTLTKRVSVSTTFSYGAVLLPVIIVVLLFFWILNTPGFSSSSPDVERMMAIIILTALSTNPLIAAFLTEFALAENQTVLIMSFPGPFLVLPSPWIIYVTYAVTMTVLMITLSVFYLKRYEY